MRRLLITVFLLVTVIFRISASWAELPAKLPVAPAPETQPSSGDTGADAVAHFYRVLLQPDPPTIEQERALFPQTSGLRALLVMGPKWFERKDVEPMTQSPEQIENRKARDRKISEGGPVVLEYLRQHKEWLTPVAMQSPDDIHISTEIRFVRTVERLKELNGRTHGDVIVLFIRDRTERPAHARTVLFPFTHGLIDIDAVNLDGSLTDGKTLLDAAVEQQVKK